MGLPAARTFAFLSALVLVVATTPLLARWARAVELLMGLGAAHGATASRTVPTRPIFEEELSLPLAGRAVRARSYRPAQAPGPALVLAHGVHHAGIDEKRLVRFARELARTGFTVITPELRYLADYRVTRDSLEVLVEAVRYVGGERRWASSPRVGLMGFSFAGGLALVAATDPRLDGRLSFVTSVGGHHDLERVLNFLIGHRIETPRGPLSLEAHEYGLAVLVYDSLDELAPEADTSALRRAFKLWLMEDRPRARAAAAECQTPEGERLFALLAGQRLAELSPELKRLLSARRTELLALSPRGKLARARVPIYLLHGSGDTVIPPSETEWAARELGQAPHAALVSPLLEHVSLNRATGLAEQLKLIGFVASML